jgi:osmotically inducible protein OsmC
MANRTSDAEWRGDLKTGHGAIKLGSGAFEGQYSYNSRFAEGVGTNPEEPIAAAHAGCFSMALAAALSERGHAPSKIHTNAKVHSDRSRVGCDHHGSISSRMLPCQASTPLLSKRSPPRQKRTVPYRKPSKRSRSRCRPAWNDGSKRMVAAQVYARATAKETGSR